MAQRRRPGEIRDAIVSVLSELPSGTTASEVERRVSMRIGAASPSSIRSYLRLGTPELFVRKSRGHYLLKEHAQEAYAKPRVAHSSPRSTFEYNRSLLYHADCLEWLSAAEAKSTHAVVTDPPYGLFEYSSEQQAKLRAGRGGVWRIPPAFDGVKRSPLPRFTVLSPQDLKTLDEFFFTWARTLYPVLVPGANVIVASNPLLSYIVSGALARAGLERRGEIVRLVMTMRGGDRPKAAHEEFFDVSVMPRAMWEPWLVFRKPLDGTVRENLRKWGTGGFRRPSAQKPFGDVIASAPTHRAERLLAPHPSLKPQAFLRQIVRAVLPLAKGIILDPFAGSGSTLAAAAAIGYASIGIERDRRYFLIACDAIPRLAKLRGAANYPLSL